MYSDHQCAFRRNMSILSGKRHDFIVVNVCGPTEASDREYLEEKIYDLEINGKNSSIGELYQGIRIERKGFQARTNIIRNENGNMIADSKSTLLNVHGEQEIDIQTPEILEYKASGIDGIPAELIKSGGEKLREKIHRLLCLIWKQEALPNIKKESIGPQCAFRRNMGKLYSIRLIGMCLNDTKSRVRVGKQVSDIFEIHNGLKQGDTLSPLLFNFVLEHIIKYLEDKEGVQLTGIHKLLVYADDIRILKNNMHILRSNTRKLGLELNINKTKCMVTNRNALCNANGQLITNEGNVEEVAELKYIGDTELIKDRLNSGNACY
ncbi:hypothetical protein C0J52_27179 [Blattella germanica]|nr:hypothetical protein C0J52_27179 [Blattella germanica]